MCSKALSRILPSRGRKVEVKISADMSDIVKQKRPIHCPLFYRGSFISYAVHKKHELTTAEISDVCYPSKVVNPSQKVKMYSGYVELDFV